MKISQPLIQNPPIKSLNHHAMFLGVLLLNPTYQNYFSSHYVNLYYDFNFKLANFISPRFYTEEEFFISTDIGYDVPDIISEGYFFELICHMMNEGYYLYGNINERYIPNRSAYQKHDLTHNILFYGLETSLRVFDSIAYRNETDSSFDYRSEELDYDDFVTSIKNTHKESYIHFSKNYLHFFKNKPDYDFQFDANLLLRQLCDYVDAQNIAFATQCSPNRVYGMAVYDAIINSFKSSEKIDLRATKLLLEHKQCMLQRIEYLVSSRIISTKDDLLDYEKIVQVFNKIHLLAIKYHLTQSQAVKELIYKEIEQAIAVEKEILQKLIIALSSTNGVLH